MDASTTETTLAAEPVAPPAPGRDAELLAQMIHDLKNPLSAILCYAEIVGEAKEDEVGEYCARLQANARALLDLLDGFALLAMLRSGDIDWTPESFDWVRQVMRVAVDMQPIATFRSQRIACETAGERLLHGDRTKLNVAMRTLIVEGLRLAAPGDTVQLRVRATVNQAVLEVVIPNEQRLRVESFFDRTRPALELVERIAVLHRGTLRFAAESDAVAATFSVPLT
jgi:signal transduction histidine kinase